MFTARGSLTAYGLSRNPLECISVFSQLSMYGLCTQHAAGSPGSTKGYIACRITKKDWYSIHQRASDSRHTKLTRAFIGVHIPNEFFLKPALNMLNQRTQNAPPAFL
jgi:hypothetical protein